MTRLPFGLVVVQILIIVLGDAIGDATGDRTTPMALAILGLHALNGLAIMGVSDLILRRARTFAFPPTS